MRGRCGECNGFKSCWYGIKELTAETPGCERWHPMGTIKVDDEKEASVDGCIGDGDGKMELVVNGVELGVVNRNGNRWEEGRRCGSCGSWGGCRGKQGMNGWMEGCPWWHQEGTLPVRDERAEG